MMLPDRRIAAEIMDDPGLDPQTYAAVLHDLARVNTVTLAHRPTLAFLARATRGRDRFSLLDVGFGDGDMLRAVARWARAQGKQADLVGIDLNPLSRGVAQAATPADLAIDYRTGDYAALGGEAPDLVISSLVAHHMSVEELNSFLRFMEARARLGWFVNDLHRHTLAYLGYPVLARLARWHPIVRHDGRLSIARSYRPAEWGPILARAGIDRARVFRVFPFRLCVERLR